MMHQPLPIDFEKIADALANDGFAIVDQFLQDDEINSILTLDEFSNSPLHFKKAGIGRSSGLQIVESIRGDLIHWVDRKTADYRLLKYFKKLELLMAFLNSSLFLSLKDIELHLTRYPIGSFYKRHLDKFKSENHRKISVIVYLNRDWKDEYGGQLRIHLDGKIQDVFPLAGRLVCLRSELIEHEVLPASKERLSITGWITDQYLEMR